MDNEMYPVEVFTSKYGRIAIKQEIDGNASVVVLHHDQAKIVMDWVRKEIEDIETALKENNDTFPSQSSESQVSEARSRKTA
jgi:hypothetical protein